MLTSNIASIFYSARGYNLFFLSLGGDGKKEKQQLIF